MSRPEGPELAAVLARKAGADAKAMRLLASDPGIDDGAVGFHAQQAIEKWLKAVMALQGLKVLKSHDLGDLLELLDGAGVDLPPGADWIDELTVYAVPMRYVDLLDSEPLDRDSVIVAVDSIEEWAAAELGSAGG